MFKRIAKAVKRGAPSVEKVSPHLVTAARFRRRDPRATARATRDLLPGVYVVVSRDEPTAWFGNDHYWLMRRDGDESAPVVHVHPDDLVPLD